jgi:putative membrane protein
LWLWHLPGPYQAAVLHSGVHALEHACFLGTALLLWWSLVRAHAHGHLGYGAGVLLVSLNGMQSAALGVLFTFSRLPWYPVYVSRTAAWGLAPLDDQRLAGVIMWVPPSVIYLAAACVLFLAWMRGLEREMPGRPGDQPLRLRHVSSLVLC